MKKTLVLMIFMGLMTFTKAQDIEALRKTITDMLEQLAEQQQLDFDYEEMLNDLINLTQNPIDLNHTNKEELEKLFFLSDFQIENLLFYQYNNGPILSIYELQAVEDLDRLTIERLLPFVQVGDVAPIEKHFTQGQFLGRVQSLLQMPEGYIRQADSIPSAYAGSRERWLTRGRINIDNRILAGFTLEKDPGEIAFPRTIPLADFSSAFVQFNQVNKIVQKVILGDYRLSFGQGLGLWTDMAFSKSTETAQLRRRSRGLNNYTSVNESSFLRGIGVELKWKNLGLTPFLSFKHIDGNVQTDSLKDEEIISSIQETGYHRTLSETKNRHAIDEKVWGGQVQYQHHLFKLEGGYANWLLDKMILNTTHLKNNYRFSGKRLESVWFAPSVFLGRLNLFGEWAMQNQKEWGVYQGLTYKPGSDIVTSIAYRYYSKGFSAILSQPFAESSIPGGESGMYASFQFKPHQKWTVKAFCDFFSYSWLRYNVYSPSNEFEWFMQADYMINRNNSFYIRYKSTTKDINSSEPTNNYQITSYSKQNIRLYYSFHLSHHWQLHTQMEQSFYKGEVNSSGWMALQDVVWRGNHINASLRYALFNIDDYNSRIYSYEPDVLYAFTIPSYQYQGSKIIVNANTELLTGLHLWLRLSHTTYRNKESIGAGYQEVKGNQLTEIKFQIQYRF